MAAVRACGENMQRPPKITKNEMIGKHLGNLHFHFFWLGFDFATAHANERANSYLQATGTDQQPNASARYWRCLWRNIFIGILLKVMNWYLFL